MPEEGTHGAMKSMEQQEIINWIKSDIGFWERESKRCKDKADTLYYLGMADGMREALSYLETGKSVAHHEIGAMITKGLSH